MTHKSNNTIVENESETLLNKLKILNPTQTTAKPWKITIYKHFQNKTRTKSKGQRNRKPEKQITNLKQSQINNTTGDNPKNAQMARPQTIQTTNIGNTISIKRAIKSKIRYKSYQ